MSKSMTGGLRLALWLYPAAYRRERQDEIAGVFSDATADAGRIGTAREAFDVAAHGLRLRSRLTSARLPGRLAAETAPVAVGAVGGWAAWQLITAPTVVGYFGSFAGYGWTRLGVAAVWLISMAAALLGRWTVARALAALTGIGTVVSVALYTAEAVAFSRTVGGPDSLYVSVVIGAVLTSGLIWSFLPLAAPPDLLGGSGRARQRVIAFSFLAGLLFSASSRAIPNWLSDYALIPVAVICTALLCTSRDRLLPAAVALAFLPLGLSPLLMLILDSVRGLQQGYLSQQPYGLVFAALLIICATVAAVRLRRPRLSRAC